MIGLGWRDHRRAPRATSLTVALALAAMLGCAAPPALAAGDQGAKTAQKPLRFGGTRPGDHADVERVERYLNGIKTLKSRFIQSAANGNQATGTFYLSRPGKMRLVYDPPFKDFVVADGLFIFYWDGEMRQQSSAPLGSSLADVILRDNLKLSGEITVKSVERLEGALEVTLTEAKDGGKGSITLVFTETPFGLNRWRVVDAAGQATEVGLIDPQLGVALDADLFVFRPPKERGGGESHSR